MKKLHFYFRTQLEFSCPVTEQFFVLRFVPQTDSKQQILNLDFRVEPVEHWGMQRDNFGNRILNGSCRLPHTAFSFEVQGKAFVHRGYTEDEECDEKFAYPSEMTQVSEEMGDFFRRHACAEPDDVRKAVRYMHIIYETMAYRPGTTDLNTTAAQAMAQKCGVCQDYAHLLIAFCRSEGIPARYVAGIFLGEGETHAWVEIYVDGRWYALDPTRNQLADDQYIKLSHGRDCRDCMVDRGTFVGNAMQTQMVYMKVEEEFTSIEDTKN